MPKYLISGHLPDDFDPSSVTEEMANAIYTLNDEMDAAGVTVFACGLAPAATTKTLRPQPNGQVLVTDGPYIEAKEHVGGLSIIEAADIDEALKWALRGAKAFPSTVEVREIFFRPSPKQMAQAAEA